MYLFIKKIIEPISQGDNVHSCKQYTFTEYHRTCKQAHSRYLILVHLRARAHTHTHTHTQSVSWFFGEGRALEN
jgi:hypothetical protein